MRQVVLVEALVVALVRVLWRVPRVVERSMSLTACRAAAASALMVLATHTSSVVVGCFDWAREASHLILAVMRCAVALTARIESSD